MSFPFYKEKLGIGMQFYPWNQMKDLTGQEWGWSRKNQNNRKSFIEKQDTILISNYTIHNYRAEDRLFLMIILSNYWKYMYGMELYMEVKPE